MKCCLGFQILIPTTRVPQAFMSQLALTLEILIEKLHLRRSIHLFIDKNSNVIYTIIWQDFRRKILM